MERYVLGDKKVTEDKTSIQSQYNKLEMNRETYLERARDCAKLTIPTLFPDKGNNEATEYNTPYQSVGARGVMNLASKLMLALFPPHAPFFRLSVDDLVSNKFKETPKLKVLLNKDYQELKKQLWITWKFPMTELQFMKH